MTPSVILVELMVTIGLGLLALVVVLDNRQRGRLLRELGSGGQRGWYRRGHDRVSRALLRTRRGQGLLGRLRGAGLVWQPLDYLTGVLLAGLALGLALRPLLGDLGGVVVFAAIWMVANRWLEGRRQKRVEAFVAQLPEVARILSNAASAGLALRSALALAARELDEPASGEMKAVSAELTLGRSLEQALDDLAIRLPSRELAVLIQTLIIQSRAGGALVSALMNIASTLEQRKELRREVRTAVSGAVFSGYIVLGIGIGSIFVMNLLSPGALDQLAQTTPGRLVLLVSSAFFTAGFVLIKRITRIEV